MLDQNRSERPPLAITMGDPAGIGPEIIARFFSQNPVEAPFVIGDCEQMRRACALIGKSLQIAPIETPRASKPGEIAVLSAGSVAKDIAYGKISAQGGAFAYSCVIKAINLAQSGVISALVTAPLHKESLHAAGIRFPGHTEILADATGTHDFGMMLVEGNLRVILTSIHLPLRAAIDAMTFEAVLRTIKLADLGCRALGLAQARIGVAGLNPHAGEGGLFGREEIEIIAPAINAARAAGFDVSGPFAPDTIFMQARRGAFDIVVAQYHDQGLIPIKLNGIEHGVNITIGLPIIRTSVDHGTAFDLAGKGLADASSLKQAVTLARSMAEHKRQNTIPIRA
jgi:4-hydroxythreonine-4-phosphate dehydrogenase